MPARILGVQSIVHVQASLEADHRTHPIDHDAADRISAAAGRDPDSPAAQSGVDHRAQAVADRNDDQDHEE